MIVGFLYNEKYLQIFGDAKQKDVQPVSIEPLNVSRVKPRRPKEQRFSYCSLISITALVMTKGFLHNSLFCFLMNYRFFSEKQASGLLSTLLIWSGTPGANTITANTCEITRIIFTSIRLSY